MLAYPPLLSQSYRNAVMDSVGLVGHWGLHDAAGTVTREETGKNDGAYVGTPTLAVPGFLSRTPGTAVTFNGSSQWVTTPASVVLGDVFTLAVWLRRNRTATGETIIDSLTGSISFQFNSSDQLQMVKGGVGVIGTGTTIAETTNIHMVAWTHNVGANVAYADMVATAVTSGTTGLSMTGGFIGSSNGFGRIGATMSDATMWNRVLAGAELSNLYRIGRGF